MIVANLKLYLNEVTEQEFLLVKLFVLGLKQIWKLILDSVLHMLVNCSSIHFDKAGSAHGALLKGMQWVGPDAHGAVIVLAAELDWLDHELVANRALSILQFDFFVFWNIYTLFLLLQ